VIDKKNLLDRTFRLERTPRPPVAFWLHLIPEAETGDALKDPGLVKKSIAAQRLFITKTRPDMVKTMSDGFFFYPREGQLATIEDLGSLQPVGPEHPWITGQAEVQRKVREVAPDLPYFYNIFSPLTSLTFLVGAPRLATFLAEDPEAVSRALERMSLGLSALAAEIVREGGADGIYLSVQNPDRDRYDTAFYASKVTPSETAVLDAARKAGGRSILHICGYAGVRNRLSDFAGYPADAVSYARTVEGVPFPEARKVFPGKALAGGFPNVQGSVLHKGSRSEVEAYARDLLKEAEGLNGILVGADCTVPSDIDLERLEWVREEVSRGY
jgi:uroporphyrinogen decarboxylase